jgi:hypothetical protein
MRKIVLWKRDGDDGRSRKFEKIVRADFEAQRLSKRRRDRRAYFDKIMKEAADEAEAERRRRHAVVVGRTGEDDEWDDNGNSAVDHHISHLADLLVEAGGGDITRAEALNWLLHDRKGQALVHRMREHVKREDTTMTADNLVAVAKDYGMRAIAKRIVEKGDSMGVDEATFTAMLNVDAERFRRTGESVAQSFSRMFSDDSAEGRTLREAYALTKVATLDVEPTFVGGADARDVNNDRSRAFQRLTSMAEELRRRSPTLSSAQAFARVFEDPGNAELAAKAHQWPAPTTSYPFPR